MSNSETTAARVAAARAVVRLLARLARPHRKASSPGPCTASGIDGEALKLALRRGWVEQSPPGSGAEDPWQLSGRGREFLKRALSGQDIEAASTAVGAASHRVRSRVASADPEAPVVNQDESALGWMRRHQGRDGRSLISEHEFQAGERLRADFWFAGMTPRVTANWSAVPGGGSRSPAGSGVEMRDGVVAAQERVRRALAAVGPELNGVLIDVCCHLKGLEDAERAAGWPQRSGKVVLQLALASLARHYGLEPRSPRSGISDRGIRHWGASDYRPDIDKWRE